MLKQMDNTIGKFFKGKTGTICFALMAGIDLHTAVINHSFLYLLGFIVMMIFAIWSD